MKSYLYVGQLPPRALTVAQQAIEEDPAFRRRVAERATESEVGRAGFLWLHRPIGWAAEFEELTMSNGNGNGNQAIGGQGPLLFQPDGDAELEVTDPVEDGVDADAAPSGSDLTWDDVVEGDETDDPEPVLSVRGDLGLETVDAIGVGGPRPDAELRTPLSNGAPAPGAFGSIDAPRGGDLPVMPATRGRNEANAIEDELSTLRGLVDRLSSERRAVSTSVRQAEQDVVKSRQQPSVFESDVYTLQSELEAARADLDKSRQERDSAIRQHSDSLTRQLELEKELERARGLRAAIEQEHAEADAAIVDVRESLARAEANLTTAENDREELTRNLATTRTENEDLRVQVQRLTDLGASQTKALEAQYKALQTETDTLRADKDALASRLSVSETELNNAKAQLSQTGNQAAEAKSLVDALTEEKIDLASRLADTEAMLETTRAQLSAVKSDSEALAADLSTIRAHRDGLATQVDELHGGLTEALADLAKVRSTSDADRAALKELRADRDLLRVRVGSLEQIEKGLEAKLANLASERDVIAARADQVRVELTDQERRAIEAEDERDRLAEDLALARERNGSIEAERDELRSSVDQLSARATELELARDGLAVQVEQLTEESLAMQAQMVDKDRYQHETSENQGRALSELAHRLAMVENDRNRLDDELKETEAQLIEALDAVGKAMETAQKAQNQLTALEAQQVAVAHATSPAALIGRTDPGVDGPTDPPPSLFAPSEPAPAPVIDDGIGTQPGDEISQAWPPPPVPSALVTPVSDPEFQPSDESLSPGSASELPPPPPADDDRPAARRHWGFGARFRGDNDDSDRGHELESPASADEVVGGFGPMSPPSGLAAPGNGIDTGLVPPPPPGSEAASPAFEEREVSDGPSVFSPPSGLSGADTPGGPQQQVDVPAEQIEADLPGQQGMDQSLPAVAAIEDEDLETAAFPLADPDATVGMGLPDEAPAPMSAAAASVAADPATPDLDLDSISSELSMAAGDVGLLPSSDDEDLDEISKLIKQTVTDFDPASLEQAIRDGGPPTEEGPKRRSFSRRLFAAKSGDEQPSGESGSPLNTPPPSVFGDDVRLPGSGVDPDQTLVVKGGPIEGPDVVFETGHDLDDGPEAQNRSGRRQIELADGIDDDIEMARQVVSSPDVVLLVDGDSVAKMGWPSLPVAQQRDALVSYLADLSNSTGASPDVVFDGRIGEEESLPASRAVRIRLSTPPTEPVAALDELVDAYPEQWPIAVVTDDEDLARSAQERGATVLNNGQLLDLFIV